MIEVQDDDLENTIEVATLLRYITDRARISAEAVAYMLLTYFPEWSGNEYKTVSRNISNISTCKDFINADKARIWFLAIDALLRNFTFENMQKANVTVGVKDQKLKNPDLMKKSPLLMLNTKNLSGISWQDLRPYRNKVERDFKVSRYVAIEGAREISTDEAKTLSGVWRVFRIANAGNVSSNISFMHADGQAMRAKRFLITNSIQWNGDVFMLNSNHLFSSFFQKQGGASSFSLNILSEDPKVFVGLRIGQSIEAKRVEGAPVRAEFLFGYRVHKRDIADIQEEAVKEEIRNDLSLYCRTAADEDHKQILDAAIKAMSTPHITETEKDLLSDGFRRGPSEGLSLSGLKEELSRCRKDVHDVLCRLRINGASIWEAAQPFLELSF